MNDAAQHIKAQHIGIEGRRITKDCIVARVTNLCISEDVSRRGLEEMNTTPLSAHTVVRQIGEHIVETVATQQTTVGDERTLHINTRLIMKEECGMREGERYILRNGETSEDDDGTFGGDDGVVLQREVIQTFCIPRPRPQVYLLYSTALEGKHEVIFHDARL